MSTFTAVPQMLVAALLFAMAGASHAQDSAAVTDTFAACAARALPERSMRQTQQVKITSELGWTRESVRSVYWQRFDDGTIKVLFHVERPPTEAGLKLLVVQAPNVDPVIHVYSPELDRVRRVVGSGASNSVLGTDFTFEDALYLQRFLAKNDGRAVTAGDVDGHPAWVAEVVPDEDRSAYSRIRTYIDKQNCLPMKSEFYGANGTLDKTLLIERAAIELIDGHTIPARMVMTNHKQRQRTELTATAVAINIELPAGLFSLAAIEQHH